MGKRSRTPRVDSRLLRRGTTGSSLEQEAVLKMAAAGITGYLREQWLVPGRRFAFDFSWARERVVLEVHGVYGKKSRHLNPKGFQNDREKMNLAQMQGWLVIEAGTDQIKKGEFIQWLQDALQLRR